MVILPPAEFEVDASPALFSCPACGELLVRRAGTQRFRCLNERCPACDRDVHILVGADE